MFLELLGNRGSGWCKLSSMTETTGSKGLSILKAVCSKDVSSLAERYLKPAVDKGHEITDVMKYAKCFI